MRKNDLTVKYDCAADVLYLLRREFGSLRSKHGDDPSLIWRIDTDSGQIIGVTVRHFSDWQGHLDLLVEQIALRLALPAKQAKELLQEAVTHC